MADMEKVIKALENCAEGEDRACSRCIYSGEFACQLEIIRDALAMLKEQENASKRNPVIVCPHCGKRIK